MAKLKRHHTDSVIDSETGEVIDQKTHSYLVGNNTEFYITYCKVIGLMEDMGLAEVKTLAWLVSNLQFNNNMISVSMGIKKKIATDMGIGISSINNGLVKLVKRGILYRQKDYGGRDAIYFIHPAYFWKGDVSERNKRLKYVLEVGVARVDSKEENKNA